MGSHFVDSIRLPAGPRIETLILCLRISSAIVFSLLGNTKMKLGETTPSDRISVNLGIGSKIIAHKVDTPSTLSSFIRYGHPIKLRKRPVARLLCGEFQKMGFDWKILSAGCTSHVEIRGGDLN